MVLPFVNCELCTCEVPSGPFDVYGQLGYFLEWGGVVFYDTDAWLSQYMPPYDATSSYRTITYTNKLARSGARCLPSVDNSIEAGQWVYASASPDADFGIVAQTLAVDDSGRDLAWYFRWRNYDNPPVVEETDYIETSLGSWTYDSGVSAWDGGDGAIEALTDDPATLRAATGPLATIPADTLLQFTLVAKFRDLETLRVEFADFNDDAPLLAVEARIKTGEVALTYPGAGLAVPIRGSVFAQSDGWVKLHAWFRTSGSSGFLAGAETTIKLLGDDTTLTGEGTRIGSVQLREAGGSGLDIVCVDASANERLARWYVRDDRSVSIPYTRLTGNPNAAATPADVPESLGDDVTLSGYSDERHWNNFGHWGYWKVTTGSAWPLTWAAATKLGRLVLNSGSAAVWEYDASGALVVAKSGQYYGSPGALPGSAFGGGDVHYGVFPAAIWAIPSHDYPNVFGLISSNTNLDLADEWPNTATFDVPPEDPDYPTTITYDTPRSATSTASLTFGEITERIGDVSNTWAKDNATDHGDDIQYLEGPRDAIYTESQSGDMIGYNLNAVSFTGYLADSIDGHTIAVLGVSRTLFETPVFHPYEPPEYIGGGDYIYHDPHYSQESYTTTNELLLLIDGEVIETTSGSTNSKYESVVAHRTRSGVRFVVVYKDTTKRYFKVFDEEGTVLWTFTPHDDLYSGPAPRVNQDIDVNRASLDHLYVRYAAVCDNRVTNNNPISGSDDAAFRDDMTMQAVFTWDGTRQWPISHHGEVHSSGDWEPDATIEHEKNLIGYNDNGSENYQSGPLDVVKNRIALAPTVDEYDDAVCDL